MAFDPSGKQDFQLLQNYQRSQKGRVVYYVFDILYLNGQDLRKLPLIERKSFLKRLHLNSSTAPIESTPFILKKGTAFFKKAEKKGLEGIIGKNTQTPYKMQRSPDWVKIKTHKRQEVVIGGYTQGKGSREKFGALLIGVYKGKALKYIGKVGTGFSRETLSYLSKLLKPLKQEKCPFMPEIPTSSATWVKPSLICEVSFSEWTRDGKLRHPTFKGMRVDKKAKQVKKERAKNG